MQHEKNPSYNTPITFLRLNLWANLAVYFSGISEAVISAIVQPVLLLFNTLSSMIQLESLIDTAVSAILGLLGLGGSNAVWPSSLKSYNNGWGWRKHPSTTDSKGNPVVKFHAGVDVPATAGTNVLAIEDGKVIRYRSYSGRGDTVIMAHDVPGIGKFYTLYQHLRSGSGAPESDEIVKAGESIGKVGATGIGTGAHLHFEILGSNPVSDSSISSASSINPLDVYLNNNYDRCRDLRQFNTDGTKATTKYNPNPFFKSYAYNGSFDKDFSVGSAKHSHSSNYGFLKPKTNEVWA